jgi:SAM-dependent methyltransferase
MSHTALPNARSSAAARCCPICDADSDIQIGEVEGRALLICPQCRHVYWRERVDHGRLRAHYDARYSASEHQAEIQGANRAYYRAHADELAVMLAGSSGSATPPRCVVDFGSSYPTFLEEARARGVTRAVGVDLSQAVREAGRGLGIEMWDPAGFAERFDGSASVIRFSHVIEHLADPVGEVAAAIALLSPGGIAYVTQPIVPVLRAEPGALGFPDAVFPEHLHFFNPISLTLLLRRAGLEIEEFFAFQAEEAVQAQYAAAVDLAHVEQMLPAGIGAVIPQVFSPLGGRPTFYGQNCRLVARKPARP